MAEYYRGITVLNLLDKLRDTGYYYRLNLWYRPPIEQAEAQKGGVAGSNAYSHLDF